MEYSPPCLDDRSDGGATELIGRALSNDPLGVPCKKALKVLARERALKTALLRVDLRIKLQKARAAVQLCLLGLNGLFFVISWSPLLRHGLDKAVELCDLVPRQRAKQKVLGLAEVQLLDADNLLRLTNLLVVNDSKVEGISL